MTAENTDNKAKTGNSKAEDKPADAAPEQSPADAAPTEIGGRDGPDPTRYGDWEKNGRCIDF